MFDVLLRASQAKAHMVAALAAKYGKRVPVEMVEEVVSAVWAEVATGARFDTYLRVLVQRRADEELRRRLDPAA